MKNILFIRCLMLLFCFSYSTIMVAIVETETTIKLHEVFGLNSDLENGIRGTVNPGGRIDVKVYEKDLNVLVYHVYISQYFGKFLPKN